MRVDALRSSFSTDYKNSKNQSFGILIKDKTVMPIINSMSDADRFEFNQIEKRLSKTKYWDLKISSIEGSVKRLKFHFLDKIRKTHTITDGIFPYEKKDDTIKVYSIVYGPDNASHNYIEELRFKSRTRASKVYEDYLRDREEIIQKRFQQTPIESLRSKEIELNMLEEAFENADSQHEVKDINSNIRIKHHVGTDLKIKY